MNIIDLLYFFFTFTLIRHAVLNSARGVVHTARIGFCCIINIIDTYEFLDSLRRLEIQVSKGFFEFQCGRNMCNLHYLYDLVIIFINYLTITTLSCRTKQLNLYTLNT